MSLSKLKPAEGSVKLKSKRIGRGQGSGKEELRPEAIKVLNLDLVTQRKLVLKVVKCHFKEES